MSSPHDKLFKLVFGQREHAAAYLERFLPDALRDALALDEARVLPGTFIDDALQDRHTDLLIAVPPRARAAGEPAETLVYVLLEHQSSVDPLMAFRLLRYMLRVWERWLADNPGTRRLPAIVPMLLYQGPRAWTAPTAFHQLVAGLDRELAALAPFTPGFRYVVTELRDVSDQALGADATALALKLMKHVHASDFQARFASFAADFRLLVLEPSRLHLLSGLVHYLFEVGADATLTLETIARAAGPDA